MVLGKLSGFVDQLPSENTRNPTSGHPVGIYVLLSKLLSIVKCSIFETKDETPDLCLFESISLKPWLRSWAANQQSCDILYGYRQRLRQERENYIDLYIQGGFFEDYVDGSIYRQYVDSLGDEQKLKFDLFLDASTDGVQMFEKKRYDC